jgi:hypothetical protein
MTKERSGRVRRRWPRAPLRGKVVGQLYTEHAAPIVDLSERGSLLEVPCALRPRSVYSVRLVIGPGTVLMLKASVVPRDSSPIRIFDKALAAGFTGGSPKVGWVLSRGLPEPDIGRDLGALAPMKAVRKAEEITRAVVGG